ncbi:hypothetical protein ABT124_15725 [Streptomyces sp. NPDC001982]|uniref:hypothetical protein n=1 Tax=Streptomyces sp. NPDC001982 TaxID=3154405 RepID=UPI0033266673
MSILLCERLDTKPMWLAAVWEGDGPHERAGAVVVDFFWLLGAGTGLPAAGTGRTRWQTAGSR